MNYYPYVSGGPAEAGHLTISGCALALYVNSRYLELDETSINPRATALFEMADIRFAGDRTRSDALLVAAASGSGYERSVPADVIAALLGLD